MTAPGCTARRHLPRRRPGWGRSHRCHRRYPHPGWHASRIRTAAQPGPSAGGLTTSAPVPAEWIDRVDARARVVVQTRFRDPDIGSRETVIGEPRLELVGEPSSPLRRPINAHRAPRDDRQRADGAELRAALGTLLEPWSGSRRSRFTEKPRLSGASFDSGGGIRTRDLRVMSPTSYLTAPPRGARLNLAQGSSPINRPGRPPRARRRSQGCRSRRRTCEPSSPIRRSRSRARRRVERCGRPSSPVGGRSALP
jgi:hypothetical protein